MSFKYRSRWMRSFTACLAGALMLGLAGCGDIYAHDEFEKMIKNRSADDVTKELGKPAAVDGSNPSRVIWTYNSITFDIDNENKRDSKTLLVMAPSSGTGKLQVVEVQYTR